MDEAAAPLGVSREDYAGGFLVGASLSAGPSVFNNAPSHLRSSGISLTPESDRPGETQLQARDASVGVEATKTINSLNIDLASEIQNNKKAAEIHRLGTRDVEGVATENYRARQQNTGAQIPQSDSKCSFEGPERYVEKGCSFTRSVAAAAQNNKTLLSRLSASGRVYLGHCERYLFWWAS